MNPKNRVPQQFGLAASLWGWSRALTANRRIPASGLAMSPEELTRSRGTQRRKQRLSGLTTGPEEPIGSRRTLRCKQTTDLNRLDRFIVLSAAATLRREDPPSNSTTFMSRLKPSVRRLGKPLPHQLTSGVSPCQPQLPPARASSSRALVDTHHCWWLPTDRRRRGNVARLTWVAALPPPPGSLCGGVKPALRARVHRC